MGIVDGSPGAPQYGRTVAITMLRRGNRHPGNLVCTGMGGGGVSTRLGLP